MVHTYILGGLVIILCIVVLILYYRLNEALGMVKFLTLLSNELQRVVSELLNSENKDLVVLKSSNRLDKLKDQVESGKL